MNAPHKLEKVYLNIAHETKGHYLIGMEPVAFFENFLPWNATPKAYKQKVPPKCRLDKLRSVCQSLSFGAAPSNHYVCWTTVNIYLIYNALYMLKAAVTNPSQPPQKSTQQLQFEHGKLPPVKTSESQIGTGI